MLFSLAVLSSLSAIAFGFEFRIDNHQFENNVNVTAQAIENNQQDYCLVFEDHFNKFDLKNWQHEISLSGGKSAILEGLV